VAASFYLNETNRSASPFYTPASTPDHVSDCSFLVARTLPVLCISSRYLLDLIAMTTLQKKGCEYKFYTEFQSHEPEFDYLKSLEIEEKINKIRWCRRQNSAHFLLSTNGITFRFFSVHSISNTIIEIKRSNSGRCLKNPCEWCQNPITTTASASCQHLLRLLI
jgi:hypothetical protein